MLLFINSEINYYNNYVTANSIYFYDYKQIDCCLCLESFLACDDDL